MLGPLEVKCLDRNSEHHGVRTIELMERAGTSVADLVQREYWNGKQYPFETIVLCGLGNNGGDGLVAARHLAKSSRGTVAVMIVGEAKASRSVLFLKNFERLRSLGGQVTMLENIDNASLEDRLPSCGVIVDAMLGVGLSGRLREPYLKIVKTVNAFRDDIKDKATHKGVVSVDVPTGFGTGDQVFPDITITFHDVKYGMTRENCGEILVAGIGIPDRAAVETGPGEFVAYPIPRNDSHKGQNGTLLIVGGGPYTGAPALAASAALRVGVDLIRIATPDHCAPIISGFSPNFIVTPLTEDRAKEQVLELEKDANAVLIGPGLGNEPYTMSLVKDLLKQLQLPLVIDADGLAPLGEMLKEKKDLMKGRSVVVTPHRGEFRRIAGWMEEVDQGSADPENMSRSVHNFSKVTGITTVLKGPVDIISDGSTLKFNMTGTPAMTVGGTGDVLSGIIGALVAKGAEPFWAARLGSYINGICGERVFQKKSYGLLASDLVEEIPEVLKEHL